MNLVDNFSKLKLKYPFFKKKQSRKTNKLNLGENGNLFTKSNVYNTIVC